MAKKHRSLPEGLKVIGVTPAGDEHQVVTFTAKERSAFRDTVCPTCPWKKANAGRFPPEAFKHSARTAYDMSQHIFSCHSAGLKEPTTCAGFLLRGAEHNMSVRMAVIRKQLTSKPDEPDEPLFEGYRSMAIGNGVSPDDEALGACRLSSYELKDEGNGS